MEIKPSIDSNGISRPNGKWSRSEARAVTTVKVVEPRPDPERERLEKEAQLEQIKLAIENYTRPSQPDIRVEIHQGTGQIMAKVVSSEDGRVIREIPPKEILDLQARIQRKVGGLLNKMI